jgi:hypothetical protein
MNIQDVEIFSAGVHAGDRFTEDDFDDMVSAFRTLGTVPLKLSDDEAEKWFGQRKGAPALGWVKSLRRVGSKLLADFSDIPARIGGLIQERKYRKTIETAWGHRDHAGRIWPRVLRGVVFSGLSAHLPRIEDLQDLQVALMSDTGRDLRAYESGEIRTYEFKEANVSDVKKYELKEIGGRQYIKTYDMSGMSDFLVSGGLTETAFGYSPRGLVADLIFWPRRVGHDGGRIGLVGATDFSRIPDATRAPGTESNALKWSVSSRYFHAKNYSLHADFPHEDMSNADIAWRLKESGTEILKAGLLLGKEQRTFNAINSASNVNTVYTVASAWNASANPGNPLSAIDTAISQVHSSTGHRPTAIVFGTTAWTSFAGNSNARDGLGSFPTTARVADYFRVETVSVAEGYYNTEGENLPGKFVPFFSDAVFACVQAGDNWIAPRYGLSPFWAPMGIKERFFAEDYSVYEKKMDRVELTHYEDELVADPKLGVIIKGVNSAQ